MYCKLVKHERKTVVVWSGAEISDKKWWKENETDDMKKEETKNEIFQI